MAVHRRALRQGDLSGSQHPLASDFMRAFAAWLPIYHHHRHGGRGMDGRSPAEVFAQERNPGQRPAPSAEALAYLLWEQKTALVRECQIRVNKVDYAAVGIVQSRLLLDRNETSVHVAYDPIDPSLVAVLDDDGRLVTMLEPKRLVRQSPEDPETQRAIAAMQQTRGGLVKQLKAEQQSLARAGKQLGVASPLQLIAGSPQSTAKGPNPPQLPITQRKQGFKPEPQSHAPLYAHDVIAQVLGRKGGR